MKNVCTWWIIGLYRMTHHRIESNSMHKLCLSYINSKLILSILLYYVVINNSRITLISHCTSFFALLSTLWKVVKSSRSSSRRLKHTIEVWKALSSNSMRKVWNRKCLSIALPRFLSVAESVFSSSPASSRRNYI